MCKIEGCNEWNFCHGWCHIHFLERFAISTKTSRKHELVR